MPLIAHRGYPAVYPENTLQGFQKAIEAGAQHVELDIQLSADLQPVLYHDRDMRRVSDMDSAIHNHTLEDLLGFNANEPQRYGEQFPEAKITPLESFIQFLQSQPELHAFVEIKRISIEGFGVSTVLEKITPLLKTVSDQITLISFSIPFIKAAKKHDWLSCGIILESWRDQFEEEVKTLKPAVIFLNIKKCPTDWQWNQPVALALYDIREPDLAQECLQRGATFIETFDIGKMQKAFGNTSVL